MSKNLLILNTIIHLKPIQIRYQLWYRIRKIWRKASGFSYPLSIEKKTQPLQFTPWIDKYTSFDNNSFSFLNISKTFEEKINWNEQQFGKLWTYNLNYMDYLLQANMNEATGIKLIEDYIQNLNQQSVGLEPYPIALRGINWIKFLSKSTVIANSRNEAETTKQPVDITHINSSLYAQYLILLNNIEYHLLANHLLEDGFSLIFGAFYFSNKTLYNKGKQIIEKELVEQFLDDGAHFELSPMYHQIILDRLLDSINLLQNNKRFPDQDVLLNFMRVKAQNMLAWLNKLTFTNGEIPLLNDSAPDIAPSSQQLKDYATRLDLNCDNSCPLSESGYRRFNGSNYECIIDVGQIGSCYQPGHAHADTFNFVLNLNNKPFLVDTGISTYETNNTRLSERGTAAHNTVTIDNENSSEVWSSFRVARRAKVTILHDENNKVSAQHNGYKKHKITHEREWIFCDNEICITDKLLGKQSTGKAHFWLATELNPILSNNTIKNNECTITFSKNEKLRLIKTQIPNGYNQFQTSFKIEVAFNKQLTTTIKTK